MSIRVAPEQLAATIRDLPIAYLLTSGAGPRPHVGRVQIALSQDRIAVSGAGATSRGHVAADAAVTLLWPPLAPEGYSLIVDGTAGLHDELVVVQPERAVLHRPAAAPAAPEPETGCAADCMELPVDG